MSKSKKKHRNQAQNSAAQSSQAVKQTVQSAQNEQARSKSLDAFLPAPPASRMYAYIIDWALGGVISGFPGVFLYAAITRRSDMFTDLYTFEALGYPWAVGMLAGLLCVIAALIYFVYIPVKVWPGQTVGKRVSHVRVVRMNGEPVGFGRMFVRIALIGFLLEGSGFVVSRYIREMAVLTTRIDVNYYWEIAAVVITLVSGLLAMFHPSRRALHDFVAGTQVVPAKGHPLFAEDDSEAEQE